jgi:hypothetical protein
MAWHLKVVQHAVVKDERHRRLEVALVVSRRSVGRQTEPNRLQDTRLPRPVHLYTKLLGIEHPVVQQADRMSDKLIGSSRGRVIDFRIRLEIGIGVGIALPAVAARSAAILPTVRRSHYRTTKKKLKLS